jgi:hypothetical protein
MPLAQSRTFLKSGVVPELVEELIVGLLLQIRLTPIVMFSSRRDEDPGGLHPAHVTAFRRPIVAS